MMSYSAYLAIFLGAPLLVLGGLSLRDAREWRSISAASRGNQSWVLVLALVGAATVYTLPWDNHLIALGVWRYDLRLIAGPRLGHVPIEEILFFGLQTMLVALWVLWLASLVPAEPVSDMRRATGSRMRVGVTAAFGTLWLGGVSLLLARWGRVTYLGWELAWALPPLALQLALGADLLWHRRRLLAFALVPAALYLSATDALAIHLGIWTITPERSLGLLIGGVLPLEELVFFSLTSLLVTVGVVLGLALPHAWKTRDASSTSIGSTPSLMRTMRRLVRLT